MSKTQSGLFPGTYGAFTAKTWNFAELLQARTAGMDLREHPRGATLSAKRRKEISWKIKNRTATKEEYRQFRSDQRFAGRRKEGVKRFWVQEQMRILSGKPTTRDWSEEQRQSILKSVVPKFKGVTIQGHHTYSASRYPHLANRGEIIFPVTFDEHLYGWHGGNFRRSLPGYPINSRTYHIFSEGRKN